MLFQMKRTASIGLLIAVVLLTACESTLPSPTEPSSPSASEPSAQGWVSLMTDPAPGPVLTGAIAAALGVPSEEVVAAVWVLRHPAGNGAVVWVFRAVGLSSQDSLDRWEATGQKCEGSREGSRERFSLVGFDTVLIHRRFIDQCQPQYLVRLDGETLAVITDDGAYAGNAATTPTVPYRPASDIGAVVAWVRLALMTVELQPGGPPQTNG